MIDLLIAQASPIPLTDFALEGLYDDLSDACFRCFEALLPIAYVLAFAGLLVKAFGSGLGDLGGAFRQIMMIAVIAVILPNFPDIIIGAQALFGISLLEELEMDPISIIETFFEDFADSTVDQVADPFTSIDGFLGAINPMEVFQRIVETVGNFAMIVAALVAYILVMFAYIVQILILYLGLAASPIFVGMLMWQSTRETGIKYIMGLIGITFWPLAWGLGLIFLEGMLTSESINALLLFIAALYPQFSPFIWLIQALVALVWIVVTVFYGPKVVSKAITTGSQIGAGMVGEAMGLATSTAGAAVAATAAVAGAAAGPAGAAAGAAIGSAAGGAISSAGSAARPDN